MHIPDGYLSPQTCVVAAAVAAPFVVKAYKETHKNITRSRITGLAALTASSFLIQMINIPLPGGTTGHAVGSVLLAITFGVWPAVFAETIVLLIQALLFGDGGILSLGANILNMALIMPISGYAFYRLMMRGRPDGDVLPVKVAVFAGIAGYIGLNIAAFLAAVELGIQPYLFVSSDGTPLYCPYSLKVSIPAMSIPHMTWAGAAEALFTGFTLWFLYKNGIMEELK